MENTIEGTVETLSATGASTIVTVTKAGSVTESIKSADEATVVIENRTQEEVAAGTAGVVVDVVAGTTEDGGTITKVDGTVVAYIGSTPYSKLQAAFDAAEDGDIVKLLKDYDATSEPLYKGGPRNLGINKSITVDGGNYTLTVTGRGIAVGQNASSNIDVTFKDITIENTASGARCIDTRGNIGTLALNGVKLSTEGASGTTQPLTIGGNQSSTATVNVTNSTIQTNDGAIAYYAIITFNPVNMTISNSTIQGWACIYAKGPDGSAGSAGSVFTIDNSIIESNNIYNGVSNAFAAFMVEDSNVTYNVTNSKLYIIGASDQKQSITSTDNETRTGVNVNLGEGNEVTFTGPNGQFAGNNAKLYITGGTFNVDPTEYVVEGYDAINNGNGTWTVQESAYVARIGETKYETLDAAIAAAQAEETVTLIKDVVLSESLVIAEGKNLTLDLGTHSISGAVNGKLITNNGTLTINASSSNPGKVYNTDVTAQGHDAVYNAEGATITINGGIFGDSDSDMTNDNLINRGAAIRNLGTATLNGGYYTDVNNFTPDGGVYAYAIINGGTMEINSGVTAYGKNHGNIATSGPLTVNGGTFSITGTRSYYNVYSSGDTANILGGTFTKQSGDALVTFCINDKNAVVNVSGGTFNNLNNSVFKSGEGTVSVTGGTFNKQPEAGIIADDYEAVDNGNGTWTVQELQSVAQIGDSYYATLEEAVAAVQSGETIVLLSDLTQDKGILYDKEGVNAKLNLNGNTITVNSGSNINSRAFRIDNGTLEVYGGSIVAVGAGTTSSDGTGCYGAFRVEANGVLNAHDLNLTNSRPWGLNVKVLGGVAELTRVNINSSYGGGIEVSEADLGTQSKAGSATLTNCTFDQKNYFDHCSTPISVSGGSELTVNGGTYTSENHVLYVFSSGGVITVNDGTFQATGSKAAIVAAIDLNTYPTYTGGLQIKGGNYTGSFAITSPAYMNITGGTFDHDPSAYVADGYASTGTGPYTVSQIQGVAAIGSQGYSTLTAAVDAATDGQTVTLLQNVELTGTSAIQINGKSITLDLNGKTITNRVSSNRTFHVYTGTLTIEGHNGQIITPDDVLNSYGFIDLKDGAANLIIKNATLEGSTQAGSLIKARASNYQITLDHVNATTKRLGSQAAATSNPNSPGVNSIISASYQGTLTVNGGSYSHDSWLAIYSGKPIGFAFDTEMANVSFTNVEVYSTLGTVVSAYKSTFTNCHIEDAQTAGASWAAAAIGLAHNEKNTIVSGYYKGKYGVAIWSTGAELNIEGGTFVGSEASIAIFGDDGNSNHKFIVNISGGDFTGNILVSGNNKAQISITGGTFDHDPSAHVADGYKATDNGNGTWTVMPVGTVTGDPVEEQGDDNE